MVLKNPCILVLWTKVSLALRGLRMQWSLKISRERERERGMDEHFAANSWEYVSLYSVLPLGDFPVHEMEAARRSTRKRETGNHSYERFLTETKEYMCIQHTQLHSISALGKRIHTTGAINNVCVCVYVCRGAASFKNTETTGFLVLKLQ